MKHWLIAALALLGLVATSPAMAQCHVGIQTGYAMANSALSTPLLGGAGIDGLGAQSKRPDVGAHGGCDLRITGTAFKVGAWAEFMSSKTEFSIQPALLTATLGNSYSVGGRLGYDMGGATPYVLVGHKWTDLDWGGAAAPALAGLAPNSLKGWTFGGGIEVPIKGTALSMAAEGRWTDYRSANLANVATLKTDHIEAGVRLNWNFYGGGTALMK